MRINEKTFRRILREEASRELSGGTPLREFKLTVSEVRALRSLGTRASRLNEIDGVEVAIAVAESKYGRRIMISILKAFKFITNLDILALRHIHSPLWQKTRDFIERKFDVNIKFSGDEFFNTLKLIAPSHYAGIVIDELIKLLSDMSDQDYQDVVKKKKKAEPEDADGEEAEEEGEKEEPEPVDRKNPPADNKRPVLPKPVDERRIRALVRKELYRPRR